METRVPDGLYAITDPRLLTGDRLLTGVEAALRGGAVMVQYRDKSAASSTRLARGRSLLALCRQWNRPLIINDDVELARRIGAQGVHLGLEDAAPTEARKRLGPHAIIGATCHQSLDLARQARDAGASYLAFGRFFVSGTKPQAPPAPLSVLGQAKGLGMPRVAIGGINLDNARQAIEAGAELLAVVQGLFGAQDVEQRAARFVHLIENCKRESVHDSVG